MADYTSDYSFTIDGVSSDTYGVWVDTLDPVPHAKQRYTSGYTGSEEPYAMPDNVFEPIKYTITFFKFFPSSLDDSAIRAFLIKGQVLQLSTLPDVYFKILSISSQTSQTADNRRINYQVSFTLKPFRYGLTNNWITLSKGDTVVNSGTWVAKPLIELTNADGDIKITVNGIDYEIKGLTPSNDALNPAKTYIDSSRFIVYNDNNMLITGKDNGIMPELKVGNNTITWTGTVDTVKIKTNWREI